MIYIATFYSHFGAIRFKKEHTDIRSPKLMPVPRNLSSSCGTCVRFEADEFKIGADPKGEIEQIVAVKENGYETIYHAE